MSDGWRMYSEDNSGTRNSPGTPSTETNNPKCSTRVTVPSQMSPTLTLKLASFRCFDSVNGLWIVQPYNAQVDRAVERLDVFERDKMVRSTIPRVSVDYTRLRSNVLLCGICSHRSCTSHFRLSFCMLMPCLVAATCKLSILIVRLGTKMGLGAPSKTPSVTILSANRR